MVVLEVECAGSEACCGVLSGDYAGVFKEPTPFTRQCADEHFHAIPHSVVRIGNSLGAHVHLPFSYRYEVKAHTIHCCLASTSVYLLASPPSRQVLPQHPSSSTMPKYARKTTVSALKDAADQTASRLLALAPELRNRVRTPRKKQLSPSCLGNLLIIRSSLPDLRARLRGKDRGGPLHRQVQS